jgi:hypothetical protein
VKLMRERMFRRRGKLFWLIALSAALAMAADVVWRAKEINQWNEEDARQVLTDSPWAKTTIGIISRLQTEDARRDGGNMGQDHGVGFDGVDAKGSKPTVIDALRGAVDLRRSSQPIKLTVRWESALPIRAAEIKAGVVEPPTLEGDGYRIAVYGVPGGYYKKDPKSLGNPLKKEAALKRAGKKDVKPSSVEVFQREDGLVVVYLFPLSAEITRKDGLVEFVARIGRVGVVQQFNVKEMQFQGNLEL